MLPSRPPHHFSPPNHLCYPSYFAFGSCNKLQNQKQFGEERVNLASTSPSQPIIKVSQWGTPSRSRSKTLNRNLLACFFWLAQLTYLKEPRSPCTSMVPPTVGGAFLHHIAINGLKGQSDGGHASTEGPSSQVFPGFQPSVATASAFFQLSEQALLPQDLWARSSLPE